MNPSVLFYIHTLPRYAVVQIDCLRKGKAKRKTRVIKKNLTPRWNERFCFLVDPVKVRKAAVKGGSKAAGITMDVYDWDRIGTSKITTTVLVYNEMVFGL